MIIPFTKAHGAKNDFLFTWATDAPLRNLNETAVAICDRHTGVGADGWYVVRPPDEDAGASIRLFNSDGSEAEVSGNGTRCAAAFLIAEGAVSASADVVIVTGAGVKTLRLMSREENRFEFEMNMGTARIDNLRVDLPVTGGSVTATLVDVGNPQCALMGEEFPTDWRRVGAELESHERFPNRSNVSFVKVRDDHTIEVRFYERGAGATMSSGTGSTGAAAAARALGLVSSPITVITEAGPLHIEWRGEDVYLTGPAEIVAKGEFYK